MDDRNNTIAMMVLGACATALAAALFSGEVFHAERPEKMGYVVEGVEAEPEAGGAAAAVPIAALLATADVAKGAEVFKKCASCHSITAGGANGIGPNLHGVLGKVHGHVSGFAYSDVLKSKPGNWDFENMNEWLLNPRKYAPGTKMTFAGLSKPEDRANVIAYLNSEGSNLPLPAAPAAAAPSTAAPGAVPEGGTPAGAPAPEGDTTAPNKVPMDPTAPKAG